MASLYADDCMYLATLKDWGGKAPAHLKKSRNPNGCLLLVCAGESHPGMWSELAKSVVALSHAAANFAVLSETRASPVGKLFGKDADWAFPAYDREQLLPTLPPEEQAHIAKCALLVRSFTRLFHTLKRTAGKDVRHAVLLSGHTLQLQAKPFISFSFHVALTLAGMHD